jgi:integrase
MPRKRQPPRLYLRADESVWVIRDGSKTIRTGCSAGDSTGAEKALAAYLNDKFQPAVREHRLASLSVPEILTAYGREHAPTLHASDRAGYAIAALMSWWADKNLSDIRGSTCRGYSDFRRKAGVKDGTIRRELAVLSAAIRHWHKEHGPLDAVPFVTRPERPEAKPDFLTRSEAALILAGCLGWYRLVSIDIGTRKEVIHWERDRSMALPHLARFFLVGIYTGTRSGAIMALQWMPNTTGGWIDFDRGILHRRGRNVGQTTKRQPQTRLGRRLLAHMARWKAMDEAERERASAAAGMPVATHMHIVSWGGRRVFNVRTSAWRHVLERVGLTRRYTPHVLRHTRATWLMQAGVDIWEAAGSVGLSVKTLETVYGHHHPDWQRHAAEV